MASIVPEKASVPEKTSAPDKTAASVSSESGPPPVPFEEVQPVEPDDGFWSQIAALSRYMTRTEVHTYAFSVAANVILSLFPFIVLLLTLTRTIFHSRSMEAVVSDMMKTFLPVGQDFVMRNMQLLTNPRKGTEAVSLVMLLITSTGVFLPLEVALNSVWGVKKNRSYLHNQVISLGLAFAVGVLAIASAASTAGQQTILSWVFFGLDAYRRKSVMERTRTRTSRPNRPNSIILARNMAAFSPEKDPAFVTFAASRVITRHGLSVFPGFWKGMETSFPV